MPTREGDSEPGGESDSQAAGRYRAIVELAALDKSNFEGVLRRILEADARELTVDRVNCWELGTSPPRIRCVGGYVCSEDRYEQGMVVEEHQCPSYFRALAENPVILADDACADPRTGELADAYLRPHGIGALMDVPVWVRGHLWGVICHEHVGPPRHWSFSDRNFAVSIGHIASMAIEARERAEAERTTRLSEFFMGVLGHDLRTPLSTIRGSVELILEGGVSEADVLGAAGRIARSTDRISRMVEQLLDFTHIRLGGGLPVRREEVDAAELCDRLATDMAAGARGKSVEVHKAGDARGLWDPDRVWQVLSNLVANALEHGTSGKPVWIALDGRDPDRLVVEVGNHGVVSPDVVPLLFDPFRRFEREGRRSHGLGLGLFITREIVSLHGGTISVSPRDGQTVFTVRLPRRP